MESKMKKNNSKILSIKNNPTTSISIHKILLGQLHSKLGKQSKPLPKISNAAIAYFPISLLEQFA